MLGENKHPFLALLWFLLWLGLVWRVKVSEVVRGAGGWGCIGGDYMMMMALCFIAALKKVLWYPEHLFS